jgi:hypothetical protein
LCGRASSGLDASSTLKPVARMTASLLGITVSAGSRRHIEPRLGEVEREARMAVAAQNRCVRRWRLDGKQVGVDLPLKTVVEITQAMEEARKCRPFRLVDLRQLRSAREQTHHSRARPPCRPRNGQSRWRRRSGRRGVGSMGVGWRVMETEARRARPSRPACLPILPCTHTPSPHLQHLAARRGQGPDPDQHRSPRRRSSRRCRPCPAPIANRPANRVRRSWRAIPTFNAVPGLVPGTHGTQLGAG